MKVSNEIKIYEINGSEVGIKEPPFAVLRINSHWNRDEMVVIEIGKEEYTISAKELRKALENATNWKTY